MDGSHSGRCNRLLLGSLMIAAFSVGAAPAQGQFFTQASDTPQIIASATGEVPVRPGSVRHCGGEGLRGSGCDSGHGGYP
jgi:hypothetical protein